MSKSVAVVVDPWGKPWPELLEMLKKRQVSQAVATAVNERAHNWGACALGDALYLRERVPDVSSALLSDAVDTAMLSDNWGVRLEEVFELGLEFASAIEDGDYKAAAETRKYMLRILAKVDTYALDMFLGAIDEAVDYHKKHA